MSRNNLFFMLFTPTYNRAWSLPRLYESLKVQTNKNFFWLIVDDGSTDTTYEIVQSWQKEGVIDIEYVWKENGGKHTAMEYAYNYCPVRFIISVDSDNTLNENAVDVFFKAWESIIKEGRLDEFAEVRAFTDDYGKGKVKYYSMPTSTSYIDSSCIEMPLKYGNWREMISCRDTEKLRRCIDFKRYDWHKESLRFISESIFWFNIGRKYKSRYINIVLSEYHMDAVDSVSRMKPDMRLRINSMVNSFYFLDENIDLVYKYPQVFLKRVIMFVLMTFVVGESLRVVLNKTSTFKFCLLILLFYLPSYFLYLKMKYIDKCF